MNDNELASLQTYNFCKCSNQNNDDQLNLRDPLPDGCYQQSNYQVCMWFGDDLWTVKIYEYRVRFFKEKQAGTDSVVTID